MALIARLRANRFPQITPQLAETVFEKTALLKWLLARVRRRASDSNRLYASELLAILMQVRLYIQEYCMYMYMHMDMHMDMDMDVCVCIRMQANASMQMHR